MQNNIDIEGSGRGITKLIVSGDSGITFNSIDNSEIRGLTIEANATGTIIQINNSSPKITDADLLITSGGGVCITIYGTSLAPIKLERVKIYINTLSQAGGISLFDGALIMSNSTIYHRGGSIINRAFAMVFGTAILDNVDIDSNGWGAVVGGVALNGPNPGILEIQNSRIKGDNRAISVGTLGGYGQPQLNTSLFVSGSKIVGTIENYFGVMGPASPNILKLFNCFDGDYNPISNQ